jgi:hypothetical protein
MAWFYSVVNGFVPNRYGHPTRWLGHAHAAQPTIIQRPGTRSSFLIKPQGPGRNESSLMNKTSIRQKFTLSVLLCLPCCDLSVAEPVSQWNFTARVNSISSQGAISLPFSAQIGDIITGTFTFDYADPGAPYIAPFVRRYSEQPANLITASLEGVPLADAPSSFRHDVEVWNNSEFHDGHDLFFMSYQTLLDPRLPGLEVSMSLSGGDQNGLTVSNLALPTSFRSGDFGGLTFGLGIIDPVDLTPSYQLGARVIDIRPANEVIDADGDGVPDEEDQCLNTSVGAVVNEHGCSIDQLVPCDGPITGGAWKNHGQYVSTVREVAEAFQTLGLITVEQRDAAVQAAARSACGGK